MDQESVVYKYSGIFFSLRKEDLTFAKTWMNLEGIETRKESGCQGLVAREQGRSGRGW